MSMSLPYLLRHAAPVQKRGPLAALQRAETILPAPAKCSSPRKSRGSVKAANTLRLRRQTARVLELLQVENLPEDIIPKRTPSAMNTWESKYASILQVRKLAKEIEDYDAQLITLELPGGVKYTPDFVVRHIGKIEIVEIKGFCRARGIMAYKLARAIFPQYEFRMLKKERGAWVDVRLNGVGFTKGTNGKAENIG